MSFDDLSSSETSAALRKGPDYDMLQRALALISEANAMLAVQRDKINALETIASHDMMTGLYNRRGLEQQIAREFNRIERSQSRGCTLVLFDLDGLKTINDTHGHPAGDTAIRTMGEYFVRTSRDMDIAARLGGDEFALVLTDINPGDAEKRIGNIAADINALNFTWDDIVIPVRSSNGFTHYETGMDFTAIYNAADKQLYTHKGRNKVAA